MGFGLYVWDALERVSCSIFVFLSGFCIWGVSIDLTVGVSLFLIFVVLAWHGLAVLVWGVWIGAWLYTMDEWM